MENTLRFLLPSGLPCTIRMQNGEDEELLSSVRLTKEGNHINAFLCNIITDLFDKGKPKLQDIIDMRISDKYYALLQSRVFSLGGELKFEYQWEKDGEQIPYFEDLNTYLFDYSKPFPTTEEEGYSPNLFKPFPATGDFHDYHYIYFQMQGKEFRMRFPDGRLEHYLIQLGDDINSNSILKGRELAQKFISDGEKETWVNVNSFKNFSPKDMAFLRKVMADFDDGNQSMTSHIINPYKPDEELDIPLLQIEDFLSPRLT